MGLSIWHLLVVLAIVLVIFGTKKLRDFGGDIGGAIRNFKQAMRNEEEEDNQKKADKALPRREAEVIEGKVTRTRKKKT